MSEVKVNKISPRTNCGTVQLGDSGDTITIPAGATITNNGTAAGFGATGAASWDTTVKTTGFTAVSGVGYFVNTTSGAITVTLPASPSAGAVVAVSDYAGTADTNAITIGRNGSNINGAAADLDIQQENSAVTLVYVDGTQGWKVTDTASLIDIELQPTYVTATGGTITCCGDYKIHTFTGPGTFCVSAVGNPIGSTTVDYLVVAGGGSGGQNYGGGGGAGGFRESSPAPGTDWIDSPLGNPGNARPVSIQGYPITVGGGGAGQPTGSTPGNDGTASVFSDITSAGGGGGGGAPPSGNTPGRAGGSGGGGAFSGASAGAGNTPPVSPPQGNPGGTPDANSSSGGGAGAAGSNSNCSAGGTGVGTAINPSCTVGTPGPSGPLRYFAGGGAAAGGGGASVGGGGPRDSGPGAGTVNTGGGSAGNLQGAGGSGIVIIRYKFQN